MSGRWKLAGGLTGLAIVSASVPAIGGQITPSTQAKAKAKATTKASDGTLLARDPYIFRFPARKAWLAFLQDGPDGSRVASLYAQLVSEDDYARWQAGTTTRTERIRYASGGLTINGVMVAPRAPGPHPLIIFNHGGVGADGRILLANILAFERLAERGYVVMASAYRGEGGSEGRPDMGGGDVNDVLSLIKLAQTLPEVDRNAIGMWGQSRGGLVTYGVLARTQVIRAAVIQSGPTDLVNAPRRAEFDRYVYRTVIPGYARNPGAALARLSPIRWVPRLSPASAVLLLHGGDDPRVPTSDALRMANALQALHRSYRLKIYEGGDHTLEAEGEDVRAEIDRWFDRYLRDKLPAPRSGVSKLTDTG